ncbi:MAG: UDP-2,3-diacylglucosamine diphosphatase [Myxococcota bacterium]|nr:UDP-2,3-diacylglucosamine diphosphatase [Myxococcota bacterium]
MYAAMLSDAHLSGLDDPNQHHLVKWLDEIEAPRVFLLGDIFGFWWGFSEVVYGDFVPVLAALERLKRRGVQVDWIRGNHDFAMGAFVEEGLGIGVHDHLDVTLGGKRYLLDHGDRADRRLGYRFSRGFLRSRVFAGAMRLLGPGSARRLGVALAGASHANMRTPEVLLEAQRRWASERLSSGFDVVVLGHSHQPSVQTTEEGVLVNLGDFVSHHSWLEVGETLTLHQGLSEATESSG